MGSPSSITHSPVGSKLTTLHYIIMVVKGAIGNSVQQLLILRQILLLNDGRDKCMKIVQYTIKLLLWRQILIGKRYGTGRENITSNCTKLASEFSKTRALIRLGNSLNSFNDMLDSFNDLPPLFSTKLVSQGSHMNSYLTTLNAVLGFFNCIADDAVAFGKIGILQDKVKRKKWDKMADRLWFATIFLDINENRIQRFKQNHKITKCKKELSSLLDIGHDSMELDTKKTKDYPSKVAELRSTLKGLQEKQYYYQVSFVKLIMDLIFCSVDIFGLEDKGFVGPGTQIISGLASGLIGFKKLYMKNK